jgi:hypothetical protein
VDEPEIGNHPAVAIHGNHVVVVRRPIQGGEVVLLFPILLHKTFSA